jgi:hypothetical protein
MTQQAAAIVTVNLLRAQGAVRRRLAPEPGQGTVEYVGLILLVAGVLAAVVAWASSKAGDQGIGKQVMKQLTTAIDKTARGSGR